MQPRGAPVLSIRPLTHASRLLLPTGGAGLPKQRPRCLHDGFLRLPAGRSRPCANRSTTDQEGKPP